MRQSSAVALTSLATLTALSLSGCFPADDGPSGMEVRNDTDQTLWIDEYPDTDENTRLRVTASDQTFVGTFECSDSPIEAQSRDGRVIAVLHTKWCPGQMWYVRGQDDWSLKNLS